MGMSTSEFPTTHQHTGAVHLTCLQVDGTGKPVGSAFASRTMGEQAKPVMQATTGSMSKPYSKEVVILQTLVYESCKLDRPGPVSA